MLSSDSVTQVNNRVSWRRAVLRWLPLALIFALSAAQAVESAKLAAPELRIHVAGVQSGTGMVQYAVFDSPRHFPGREGRIAKGEVPASAGGVTIVVKGLRPGQYAVAVFHDENGNDEFDQGVFGIPLETYGFSNDARGFFSAPKFSDARFELRGPQTTISITLAR